VVGERRYYDTYGRQVAGRDPRNLVRDTTAYDLMNRVIYSKEEAGREFLRLRAIPSRPSPPSAASRPSLPEEHRWDTTVVDPGVLRSICVRHQLAT
jgi:hypothetical protein